MESNVRPILCGTDFSAAAIEAVDVAASMAKRLKTKLVLVHVTAMRGIAKADPGLFEAALSQERAELHREANRLQESGVTVEEQMRAGSAFDELVNAAVEARAQVIVVGAIGHGVARRLLVGSVAERTAGTSPIPTLVVRPGSKLGPWVNGKQPLKILVGYDFSPAGDAALRWVNSIQSINACKINVLHIDWPPEEAKRLGYHGPLPLTENPAQLQNFIERDLSERVAMILPPENVTLTVEPGWGQTEAYLFEKAHRWGADLVVIGTHRRHGLDRLRFGSVSRAVLHHATVTVAVVPPEEEQLRHATPKLDRVLVATDFSELGNKAVAYGCVILPRGGALKLIHVRNPVDLSESQKAKPRPGKDNPKLRAQLRSLVPPEMLERLDIEEEVIDSDDPAKAIVDAAQQFGAGAICLGSDGPAVAGRKVAGSVTAAVLEKAKCPVLVVGADQA